MKLGLFGGTFNPIHFGHILAAETAYKKLSLDKVIFLPSGKPPHKNIGRLIPFKDRYDLIAKAIEGYSYFEVSDLDYNENDFSFTVSLIKKLRKKYPLDDFYFIIGTDNVTQLKSWYNYRWLLDNIKIVVISRNYKSDEDWSNIDYLDKLLFIDMKKIDISSSELFEKAEKGIDLKEYVPEPVDNYFRENFSSKL